MSSETPNEDAPEPPSWRAASAGDFAVCDVNAALSDTTTVECSNICRVLRSASEAASKLQNAGEERALAMLGAIASFHFKPEERDEPFGPMARFGDRRTAQPSDFAGEPVAILAARVDSVVNPGLRARIADVVWLFDRKRARAGHAALAAYIEIVEGVRDGRFSFHGSGFEGHDVAQHLRRALQLAKALGWDATLSLRVRDLVGELRAQTAREHKQAGFLRLANLDLDYRISDSATIATEAESFANKDAELHARHALLRIAGRAYRQGGKQTDSERCFFAAAECLVLVANASGGSAMFETHWLDSVPINWIPSGGEQ